MAPPTEPPACGDGRTESAADRWARMWDKSDIAWFAKCSLTTVEGYVAEADFPPPADIPGRLARWLPEDVHAWFAHRARSSTPRRGRPADRSSRDETTGAGHESGWTVATTGDGRSVPIPHREPATAAAGRRAAALPS